jgi:nucleoside-diphosphate-sugar epimerase
LRPGTGNGRTSPKACSNGSNVITPGAAADRAIEGETANAYNISNPNSICTIGEIAQAIADAAGVALGYDQSHVSLVSGDSLMENSSLQSDKLEALGWKPAFDLERGTSRMIATLLESSHPFTI